MPRPELYPVKKVVGFDEAMISAIEKWRRKQTPIPNASEAVRRLVELGLASGGSSRVTSKKAAATSSAMASREIDRLHEKAATPEQRASRKRRLLKGPKEFRGMRDDLPKQKR
jgi:hypothetical protein